MQGREMMVSPSSILSLMSTGDGDGDGDISGLAVRKVNGRRHVAILPPGPAPRCHLRGKLLFLWHLDGRLSRPAPARLGLKTTTLVLQDSLSSYIR
jgi:hypothetical protein